MLLLSSSIVRSPWGPVVCLPTTLASLCRFEAWIWMSGDNDRQPATVTNPGISWAVGPAIYHASLLETLHTGSHTSIREGRWEDRCTVAFWVDKLGFYLKVMQLVVWQCFSYIKFSSSLSSADNYKSTSRMSAFLLQSNMLCFLPHWLFILFIYPFAALNGNCPSC